jgi:hypothetical protein
MPVHHCFVAALLRDSNSLARVRELDFGLQPANFISSSVIIFAGLRPDTTANFALPEINFARFRLKTNSQTSSLGGTSEAETTLF